MDREDFVELQQALGITHHPRALLLDRSLDVLLSPVKVYMHDWMHALYVDGVVNLHVYLLFEAFIGKGLKNVYETFSDYAAKWKWPGRLHGNHLAEIFSAARRKSHRDASHIKCQASDLLSLTPVLAHFVQTVLLPCHVCDAECLSFLALADIVEIILSTSRNQVRPEMLLARVHRFLQNFVDAFGYNAQTPKFHWLLHLPECLLRFGLLLNCFVLERKHRTAKRYATDITNTSKNPSKSLLAEVLCHQFGMLLDPQAFNFEVGLVGGRKAPKAARKLILEALGEAENTGHIILVAKESRFNQHGTCMTGDVVLVKEGGSFRAGRVKLHCSIEGEAVTFVNCWQLVSHEPGQGYAVWEQSDTADLLFTSDIVDTVPYMTLPNGHVGTLLPIDYR